MTWQNLTNDVGKEYRLTCFYYNTFFVFVLVYMTTLLQESKVNLKFEIVTCLIVNSSNYKYIAMYSQCPPTSLKQLYLSKGERELAKNGMWFSQVNMWTMCFEYLL